jgi:DNA polymerase
MTFKSYVRVLRIDLETFSEIDLKKAGLYRYAFDPSFEILLFAYRYNNGPVTVIDLASGEKIPASVLRDLTDPKVLKCAHNAQFERVCLGVMLGHDLDPREWRCTMVKCASMGLPMGLDHASAALRLTIGKDKEGKALISFFCKPCKPTKKNGFRTRNLPVHEPEKWRRFKSYNGQDVEVETAVDDRLSAFTIPDSEFELWYLDQRINDRGVHVDPDLVDAAVRLHTTNKDKLLTEAAEITGLFNPNALPQLKAWLSAALDEEINTLNKDDVKTLIGSVEDENVRRVLQIRQETSKSSIDKYTAMQRAVNFDERIRGLLQFYGALTGRWSGKLVQPHNLMRNNLKLLDAARELVLAEDIELIEIIFGSLSYVLSQLIRTAIVPKKGHKLIMSDFSSIESRVLAWVAGETWKIDAFRAGRKIYEEMGVRMFNITLKQAGQDEWRQKAKIGELACGYQGSVGAIARMWPKHLKLPPLDERKEIVGRWRNANRKIVKLWYDVQDAAINAVQTGRPYKAARCTFFTDKGFLFCRLPSGRCIAYCRPRIVEGRWGKPALVCHSIGKNYQWKENSLYGGLLVENLVQGIARDLLGVKMLDLYSMDFDICFHVHDEVVVDVPDDEETQWAIDLVQEIMSQPVAWASGLPLDAKTVSSPYYKKE